VTVIVADEVTVVVAAPEDAVVRAVAHAVSTCI
jgi:hypothetical protein